jgi:hypothetical protein
VRVNLVHATASEPINPQSQYTRSNRASARRFATMNAEAGQAAIENSHARTRLQGPIAVVARMANFIIERTAEGGGCTESDLRRAGFLEEDLKHLPAAVRIAAKRAPGLQGGA